MKGYAVFPDVVPAALREAAMNADPGSISKLKQHCPGHYAALMLHAGLQNTTSAEYFLAEGVRMLRVPGVAGSCPHMVINLSLFVTARWMYDHTRTRRCRDHVPIFVVDTPWVRRGFLKCTMKGVGITETFIHRWLLQARCRVRTEDTALLTYVPTYASCIPMDVGRVKAYIASATKTVMTVEGLESWHVADGDIRAPHRRVVVEALPYYGDAMHCMDCLRVQDVVIPSAVIKTDADRLSSFAAPLAERSFLLTWHGEHENSTRDARLAVAYKAANATIRLRIINELGNKPDVSVGGPTIRYFYAMARSVFCLAPKGQGWWTARLFETFYAGCIPVIMSDQYVPPFKEWIPWDEIAIWWPMERPLDDLYDYLRKTNTSTRLRYRRAMYRYACWFDYHSVDSDCSAYQGLLRALAQWNGDKKNVGLSVDAA
eukprot:GEMP01024702.1.p1 GENE.GEMP01024702.1~~GEMP01024702.1.p1  ORF type:complete len:430 (+),score=108.64 GEMP01024702.1:443-1732(+)